MTGQSGNNAPDSETAAVSGSVAVRVLLDCGECAAPGQAQSGTAVFTAAAQPDPNGAGIIYDSRGFSS